MICLSMPYPNSLLWVLLTQERYADIQSPSTQECDHVGNKFVVDVMS